MTLDQQIQMLRKQAHLTQSELADKVGCCTNSIAQLEQGKLTEQSDLLIKIGEALHQPLLMTRD